VSATDDVARMLTLVPWLLERPGASLTEIATTFGVSQATIERDLGHLDFCGLPGLGGGDLFDVSMVGDRVVVQMADELRRPLRPTASEALRLVLTVDAVAEVLGEELPVLRSAVAKVRRALGIPEGAAEVVEPSRTDAVATIREAIHRQHRIELAYQGRTDARPQTREVDPWALHVVDGDWYVQGHDHDAGDRRSFRLDRVADLRVTDQPIEHPAPEELPAPRYVPGPDDLQVRLEVTGRGRWLIDAIDVDVIEERDDGRAQLSLRTDAPGWVVQLVLMAGGEATILEPTELARDAADLARQALGPYLPKMAPGR
jgi:proteasome accessory factor C